MGSNKPRSSAQTVVTIDEALRRAMVKADEAFFRHTLTGAEISPEQRKTLVTIACVYVDIARALQAEREFEANEIDRIREAASG